MSTQIVTASVMLNTGELVSLQSTATDGTESELKTSGTVGAGGGITATSIGTYANGKSITHFIQPASCAAQIQYCYLARRGEILRCIEIGSSEQMNAPVRIAPIQLQAGDSLRILTGAATADIRQVNYNVVCNDGTNAIFTAQPSTATSGSFSLTHILSGQSLGSSLTGRRVVSHFATGTEGARYASGSVLLVNDRGLPMGGSIVVNPQQQQMQPNSVGGATIALNWQAQIVLIA
jgi:hypothetical protein|tara:strand:- start:497 stop:1201 length:705 start_codon:yes stop_codon:yes gene_type:complete